MSFPFRIIDLTHTLTPTTPSWNGGCGFHHEIKLDYKDCATDVKFRVQQIKMHAGIGTHIDAPSHCIPNGKSVADLELQTLIAPCSVIDVSKDACESLTIEPGRIHDFEKIQGLLPGGSFVIFYTGWDKFWTHPERYRNNYRFPSVGKKTAELLLERRVVGLGIDTLSPDRPEDGFPVHHLLLGAGCYIVENVANACALPPTGFYTCALPLKTQEGTEAPVRLVGLIPK